MIGNPLRPNRRLLDMILVFVIALLVVAARAHLSRLGEEFAEFAAILVWFGLTYAWLRANAFAISQEEWQESGRTYRINPGRITVHRSNIPVGSWTSDGQQEEAIQVPQPSTDATEIDVPASQTDAPDAGLIES